MSRAKKERTDEYKRRINAIVVNSYAKRNIEEYNFAKLIRNGMIVEDNGQ